MVSHGGLCESCVCGTTKDYTGKGKVTQIEKIDAYVNGPDDSKTAVLIVGDVFGWEFPNTRLIADKVATAGHLAILADINHGTAWKKGTALSQENFQNYLKNNPDERVQGDLKTLIGHLQKDKKNIRHRSHGLLLGWPTSV